jgi:hypothetical protein
MLNGLRWKGVEFEKSQRPFVSYSVERLMTKLSLPSIAIDSRGMIPAVFSSAHRTITDQIRTITDQIRASLVCGE